MDRDDDVIVKNRAQTPGFHPSSPGGERTYRALWAGDRAAKQWLHDLGFSGCWPARWGARVMLLISLIATIAAEMGVLAVVAVRPRLLANARVRKLVSWAVAAAVVAIAVKSLFFTHDLTETQGRLGQLSGVLGLAMLAALNRIESPTKQAF